MSHQTLLFFKKGRQCQIKYDQNFFLLFNITDYTITVLYFLFILLQLLHCEDGTTIPMPDSGIRQVYTVLPLVYYLWGNAVFIFCTN